MTHSHFYTSYTAHGFASSLFPGFFRLVYFLKAHLFTSWACNPLFLPLGLNGFSIHSLTLFCPCYWASSFFWASKNDHQHLTPWTYEAFLRFICELKTSLPFLSFLLLFLRGLFRTVDPNLYIFFFSCHEQCCLFEFPSLAVILKSSHRFINFIPYLMADPSNPFVLVLMPLVFKGKSLQTLNTNIFSLSNTNTSFVSLSSLCSPSPTLSSVYSDQPLRRDASERLKLFPP